MKKWPRYAEFVLAGSLLLVALDLGGVVSRGQHFVPPSTVVDLPPIAAPPAVEPISRSLVDALFGHAPPPAAVPRVGHAATDATPAAPQHEVPDPASQMTLVGTIVSPGKSIALVMQGGRERVVSEGATLGDFEVAAIHDNEIVLSFEGQQRTLHLPSFQPPPQAQRPAPQKPVAPQPRAADGHFEVSRTDRDRAFAHTDEFLKTFRILPNTRNGASYGARLVFVEPASLMSAMGLAQDDILLYIDGKPVSMENQPDHLKAFEHDDRLIIKIERGGRAQQLTVEFR